MLTASITTQNLRQAATAVSQYCSTHSKGKAKQSAVAEALSQFLGFRDVNTAIAQNKTPGQTKDRNYILRYKGFSVIHDTTESMLADLAFEITESELPLDKFTFKLDSEMDYELPRIIVDDGESYYADNGDACYFIEIQPFDKESKPNTHIPPSLVEAIIQAKNGNDVRNVIAALFSNDNQTVEKSNPRIDLIDNVIETYRDVLIASFVEMERSHPGTFKQDIFLAVAVNATLKDKMRLYDALELYNTVEESCKNHGQVLPESLLILLDSHYSAYDPVKLREYWLQLEKRISELLT